VQALSALLHGARIIGMDNTARAARYAVRRLLADRGLAALPVSPRRVPGALIDAVVEGDRVELRFEAAALSVVLPGPGRVALGWDGALDEPSYAVVAPVAGGGQAPGIAHSATGCAVRGTGIEVLVGQHGEVQVLDGAGRLRWTMDAPQFDGAGWAVRCPLPPGASVHGLGGRTSWSLGPGSYRCWNTDPGGAWLPGRDPLSVAMPAMLVLDDHGAAQVFADDPCDGTVDVQETEVGIGFVAGPARLHLAIGTLPEALDSFTQLTGRPAAPPRWALGHHQARWGYGSAQEVLSVARRFQEHDLPLSAMQIDIDFMDRYRNFTFNESFSNVQGLVEDLAEQDVRLVVIVDAGTAKAQEDATYRDGSAADVFCRNADGSVFEGVVWPGPTVFPDFTAPRARLWWGDRFAAYTSLGIAGYWHDMNELKRPRFDTALIRVAALG
jgi:alpha-glucosidase